MGALRPAEDEYGNKNWMYAWEVYWGFQTL